MLGGDYSFNLDYISMNKQNVNRFLQHIYIIYQGLVSSVNVNRYFSLRLQYPTDCVYIALCLHLVLT